MRMQKTTLLAPILLAALAFAGCHGAEDDVNLETTGVIKLAFLPKDTDQNPEKDPQRLAAWIEEQTGIKTEIYAIDSDGAAIEALRFDRAHAAFFDGAAAWIGWKSYGLEAIAADQKGDGRTYYNAQAWVRADSPIQDFADLKGTDSCHTGLLKSAGMFMPMGYLIKEGHAEVVGDPDDINSLVGTVDAFFGTPTIPEKGQEFYNYDGALKCLSVGHGDVAFIRDSTWDDYCGKADAPDWCLDKSAYRQLPAFGQVPSHPVMVSPHLDATSRDLLRGALLALNDSPEGQSILEQVLETPGITGVTTEEHLGTWSENLEHVPGVKAHFMSKHKISTA